MASRRDLEEAHARARLNDAVLALVQAGPTDAAEADGMVEVAGLLTAAQQRLMAMAMARREGTGPARR